MIKPTVKEPNLRMRLAVLIGVGLLVVFVAIPFYIMGAWLFICHDLYSQPYITYVQALWMESVVAFIFGCYYLVTRETKIE